QPDHHRPARQRAAAFDEADVALRGSRAQRQLKLAYTPTRAPRVQGGTERVRSIRRLHGAEDPGLCVSAYADDHLAERPGGLVIAVGVGGVIEGKHSVDNRAD